MAMKIVLVDDEPFATIAYTDALSHAGFTVAVAHDGEDAMPLIKKEMPDAVVLDLIMPRKDGMTVLSELKNDPNLKNIPVIVVSNLSQETNIEEAKKMGAADYIVKTDISLKELVERISKQLGM
jgi:two-component system, OmpR family, alkaline phosphatase synthesis response regulator PhoP